ncbi:MAG: hypothetical protein M1828_003330 [Chrysothrix sp. TS-e1954]|nr:MAG: hypothetical protein M1828_003330 [Chrysothrix sp. TS-e1954]
MKPTQLLTTALACSTLTAAWPWPPSVADMKALNPIAAPLVRRQDDGDKSSPSPSTAPKSTSQPSQTASPSNSKDSKSTSKDSSSSSSSSKSSDSKSKSGNKSSATKTTSSVSINPAAGAGGIALITPATTLAESAYYKVDDTITWVWNYTSLTSAPSAIDILLTVGLNADSAVPSAFTIATNVSYAATQTFSWDSGKYNSETRLLPVSTYTLLVYDAALPTYSATASPGFLGLYDQFAFGLYTGKPRVDLTDPFVCATCNGAAGLGRVGVGFLGAWVAVVVVSCAWFAGAWGVF